MTTSSVVRPTEWLEDTQDWGKLEWIISGAQGTSQTMTVGRCTLLPSRGNPVHYHPNCDEILTVLAGQIEHRIGDEYVVMEAGDTVSIPTGLLHGARNLSNESLAVMQICFSTAHREVIGE